LLRKSIAEKPADIGSDGWLDLPHSNHVPASPGESISLKSGGYGVRGIWIGPIFLNCEKAEAQ
jgi:hypothetical protein